jgi:CBS domain-containing protein
LNVAIILQYKGDLVHTIGADASLEEAARSLDEKRIGALVVVDELRRVRGVLSERDITREIARRGAAALGAPVSAAMSENVITASPSDTVEELMDRMTDRRVRHLPVVTGAGRLCGIVSIGDVVKWRLQAAVSEVEAMREYITMR